MSQESPPVAYSYLRMSTDIQLKGDSHRRQLEDSAEWIAKNGLTPADDSQIEDIGVSAFRGANVTSGALGKFLTAVESGKVPRGSFLVVESLDRISRQKLLEGHRLFLRILEAGINLVTLADNHVYRADQTDIVDLMTALLTLKRSNEESVNKSRRIGKAWGEKRRQAIAARKPMTLLSPGWLKLSEDRQRYEEIPERVAIVRRIFEECANGIGTYSIAARLNADSVPTFGKSKAWHKSYVMKTLSSRAVLGEFQPHILRVEERVPEGEPVADYFPRVIDNELFYRAQNARIQRKTGSGGRKGERVSNLFSGLAKCGHCGATMIFENKGYSSKGGRYLLCDSAKRGLGCAAIRWRYEDFEASFLSLVREMDLASLVQDDSHSRARIQIESDVAALQGAINELETRREKTFQLYLATQNIGYVAEKLTAQETELGLLKSKLKEKAEAKAKFASDEAAYLESKANLQEMLNRLQSRTDEDVFKLRAQIVARLRALVSKLELYTLGSRPWAAHNLAQLRNELTNESGECVDPEELAIQEKTFADNRALDFPMLRIVLFNGVERFITPDGRDPSVLYEMHEESDTGVLVSQPGRAPDRYWTNTKTREINTRLAEYLQAGSTPESVTSALDALFSGPKRAEAS